MTLQNMAQVERGETSVPRSDASLVAEQASRAASFLYQDVADREVRARKAGELLRQITERFDSYDALVAESRRRGAESDERAAERGRECDRLREEHDVALADVRGAHAEELASLRAAHAEELRALGESGAAQLASARQRAEEDAERMREGVERLKEDLGRRFSLLEGRLREVEGENADLRDEKENLLRSITGLVTAVEAQARSLQAEEGALAAIVETFSSHGNGAAPSPLVPEVIPFPHRQIAYRPEPVEDVQVAVAARQG